MSGRPRQLLPGLCSSPEQRIMAPKLTWLLEADRWAGGARGYAGLSITVASDASWCARNLDRLGGSGASMLPRSQALGCGGCNVGHVR